MNSPAAKHSAREKLTAVLMVYEYGFSISEVCEFLNITRPTWYTWEAQLKKAVSPIWGGLSRHHLFINQQERSIQ